MMVRPNFDWITHHLAVGGRFAPQDIAELAASHGVQAVVDLRLEEKDDETLLDSHGITLLHLPTEDMCGVDPVQLDEGVRTVSAWLDDERRVLVHCEHGIGRSATLALCVLVHRGMAPMDALRLMKDRRGLVSPSPDQFACWAAWLQGFREKYRRVAWTTPTFEEFQDIAYRHLREAG